MMPGGLPCPAVITDVEANHINLKQKVSKKRQANWLSGGKERGTQFVKYAICRIATRAIIL
jgi:hypothetical protein